MGVSRDDSDGVGGGMHWWSREDQDNFLCALHVYHRGDSDEAGLEFLFCLVPKPTRIKKNINYANPFVGHD